MKRKEILELTGEDPKDMGIDCRNWKEKKMKKTDVPTKEIYNQIYGRNKNDLDMSKKELAKRIAALSKSSRNKSGKGTINFNKIFEENKRIPCHGCNNFEKCASEKLACRNFSIYVSGHKKSNRRKV